jgi:hypothetical protein
MDRRGRGMSCPYIFTPDDCPDGTKYCITNKECGKARYSARGTCKKKDGIEVSATNMQQLLPLFLSYCRWDNNFNSFFN